VQRPADVLVRQSVRACKFTVVVHGRPQSDATAHVRYLAGLDELALIGPYDDLIVRTKADRRRPTRVRPREGTYRSEVRHGAELWAIGARHAPRAARLHHEHTIIILDSQGWLRLSRHHLDDVARRAATDLDVAQVALAVVANDDVETRHFREVTDDLNGADVHGLDIQGVLRPDSGARGRLPREDLQAAAHRAVDSRNLRALALDGWGDSACLQGSFEIRSLGPYRAG